MPDSHNQEVYYYYFQLKWILLVIINMLRPEVFLFFTYQPTLQSIFKLTLLVAVLILFLVVSFEAYLYKLDSSYLVILWIELVHHEQRRWCFPLLIAAIFAFICPAPIFYYFSPSILLLCIWPSFKTLISRVFCCQGTDWQNQAPLLELTLEYFYYYDLRWVLLLLVNQFLRPYLAYLFFDHINLCPRILLKAFFLIFGMSLAYLFTSLKICFTEDDNGHFLTLLRVGFRGGWSSLVTIAFVFSVLCPTPVFLYLHPWILLLSLWPSFSLSFVSHLFFRLYAALSAFLSFGLPIIPSPPEPHQDEEEDPALLV